MKAMLKAYAACVPSQVVDQLLVAGAEVGGADGQGRTPLHLAAIAGQEKVGAGCGGGGLALLRGPSALLCRCIARLISAPLHSTAAAGCSAVTTTHLSCTLYTALHPNPLHPPTHHTSA